jgi:hypothetical protein
MKLNDVSSVASFFFSKGTYLVKENPKSLIGITALGLLSVAYKNRGSNSFNIRFSTENLREITSQVVNHSYIKFLEVAVLLGNRRAFLALSSIYIGERNHVLEGIPDRMVSLMGIPLDGLENSSLEFMLENADENDISTAEYSLKDLCGNFTDLSIKQLPESTEIAERLIESLKDESRIPELIAFCSESSSKTQSLFAIVHYLGLDNFQNEHLEPFNKIFPEINEVPATIYHIELSGLDVRDFDFSGLKNLKTLNLNGVQNLTAKKFNAISKEVKASIKTLNLRDVNATGFDLSGFTNLKTLNFKNVHGLRVKVFNTISQEAKASIETLTLSYLGVKSLGIELVGCLELIGFSDSDSNFDFSGFTNLKTLNLSSAQGLTANQFDALLVEVKSSIETLILKNLNVTNFDFSGLIKLKTLDLSDTQFLLPAQFNAIPANAKASIETLDLSGVDVAGFDFSGFTNLKTLNLSNTQFLSPAQFNAIPASAKASIETLNLNYVDVTDFDFSGFTGNIIS